MRIDTLQVHMYVALMYLKFDRIACFMYVCTYRQLFPVRKEKDRKKVFLKHEYRYFRIPI